MFCFEQRNAIELLAANILTFRGKVFLGILLKRLKKRERTKLKNNTRSNCAGISKSGYRKKKPNEEHALRFYLIFTVRLIRQSIAYRCTMCTTVIPHQQIQNTTTEATETATVFATCTTQKYYIHSGTQYNIKCSFGQQSYCPKRLQKNQQ